ncbi:HTH-type transcriptional regulator CysL [Paraliobacillus quinghaiensis]|uniref:HTH-type transcriptional regulator CysL n=1 Tax=Paraliobacillus quinghaiensis TaxID=470815 RepID=A0A917TMK7_9BACI|nr:LysR family transcriptional regulator [Paraliobacillus quinghaiensis]GGM27672.1 HTH-type transcriptional regulator CysL [Paraliobacillus quinghaiensis]
MQYDALKTFVTLIEVGNFTKTAEKLRISQPSVSLHLKNLEKEFETQLLDRSPKSFNLTPTGELLYNRAKQMLSIYEQAKRDILAHHNAISGSLKIGASFTIGEYILPGLLVELQEAYPNLTIEAVIGNTEEIVKSVRLLQVDIGLIEGQTNEKEIEVHPFMEDQLYLVASSNHAIAKIKNVSFSNLQNQLWVTREEGSGTREYLLHMIRSQGIKVDSFLTISSNQGIKETLMKGKGISLLSKSVIAREVTDGHLSIIPLTGHSFTRTFSCIYVPIMKQKKNVETFLHRFIK